MHQDGNKSSPQRHIPGNIAGLILLLAVIVAGCLLAYFLTGQSGEEQQPLTQVDRQEPTPNPPVTEESQPPASQWRSVNAGSLRFQITPSTTTWKIGEIVTLRCSITNIGEKPLSFAPFDRSSLSAQGKERDDEPILTGYLEHFVVDTSGKRATTIEETHRSIGIRKSDFKFIGVPGSPKDKDLIAISQGQSWEFTREYIVDWYPGKYSVHLIYHYSGYESTGIVWTDNPNAWHGQVLSNILEVVVEGTVPPIPTYSDDEIIAIIADTAFLSRHFIARQGVRQRLREHADFFLPKIINLYKDDDMWNNVNARMILGDVYEEMAVPVALQLLDSSAVNMRERTLDLICDLSTVLRDKRNIWNTCCLMMMRDKVTEMMLVDREIPIRVYLHHLGRMRDERIVLILIDILDEPGIDAARILLDLAGNDPAWPKRKAIRADYHSHAREWWEKSGRHKTWPTHSRLKEITEKMERELKASERK